MSSGAAGLGGWIPIFLNEPTLAITSLAGLLTLLLSHKLSGILALGLGLALLILASGLFALVWSLTHRTGNRQLHRQGPANDDRSPRDRGCDWPATGSLVCSAN